MLQYASAPSTPGGEVSGDSKAAVAAQLRLRGLTVVDVDRRSPRRHGRGAARPLPRPEGPPRHGHGAPAGDHDLERPVAAARALRAGGADGGAEAEARHHRRCAATSRPASRCRQAMAKHPKVFNDLFVAMVRAGETGGNLEEVLERVAVQLEKDDNLRRTVRSAMVYPILIGVFAVLGADRDGAVHHPDLRRHVQRPGRRAARTDPVHDRPLGRDAVLLVRVHARADRHRDRLPQVEEDGSRRVHVGHDQAAVPDAHRRHRAQDRGGPVRADARHPDGVRRADPAGASTSRRRRRATA